MNWLMANPFLDRIGEAFKTTSGSPAYLDLKKGFISPFGIAPNSPWALANAVANSLISGLCILFLSVGVDLSISGRCYTTRARPERRALARKGTNVPVVTERVIAATLKYYPTGGLVFSWVMSAATKASS